MLLIYVGVFKSTKVSYSLVKIEKEKSAAAFISYIQSFLNEICNHAGLSLKLSSYNINPECFDSVATLSLNDGAMIVNPRSCSKSEVIEILKECL